MCDRGSMHHPLSNEDISGRSVVDLWPSRSRSWAIRGRSGRDAGPIWGRSGSTLGATSRPIWGNLGIDLIWGRSWGGAYTPRTGGRASGSRGASSAGAGPRPPRRARSARTRQLQAGRGQGRGGEVCAGEQLHAHDLLLVPGGLPLSRADSLHDVWWRAAAKRCNRKTPQVEEVDLRLPYSRACCILGVSRAGAQGARWRISIERACLFPQV